MRDTEEPGRGRGAAVGILAMTLAIGGIAVSVAGQRFGHPFLESHLGPGVTLSAVVLWFGYRVLRRRRR